MKLDELQRGALTLRLREAQAAIGQLFEGLALEAEPLAMLADASRLSDLASEVEAALVRLSKPADALATRAGFVGLGDLVEIDDKGAQRVMGERFNSRADAQDEVAKWTAA